MLDTSTYVLAIYNFFVCHGGIIDFSSFAINFESTSNQNISLKSTLLIVSE